MGTIGLTVMGVELDFRLSRMKGLGRTARFLYLHCEFPSTFRIYLHIQIDSGDILQGYCVH